MLSSNESICIDSSFWLQKTANCIGVLEYLKTKVWNLNFCHYEIKTHPTFFPLEKPFHLAIHYNREVKVITIFVSCRIYHLNCPVKLIKRSRLSFLSWNCLSRWMNLLWIHFEKIDLVSANIKTLMFSLKLKVY